MMFDHGQSGAGVEGVGEESGDVRFPNLNSRQRIWGLDVEVDIRPGDGVVPGGWGEEQEDPTSGVVWPVTLILAECFDRVRGSAFLAGKRVLEVGSGTGVLGIGAAALGAHVTLSDLPSVVPHLEANVARNRPLLSRPPWGGEGVPGTAEVRAHVWGERVQDLNPPFDLVLGSDLLYWGGWSLLDLDTRDALLATLCAVCSEGTEVWLAFVVRDPGRELSFLLALARHFHIRVHAETPPLPARDAAPHCEAAASVSLGRTGDEPRLSGGSRSGCEAGPREDGLLTLRREPRNLAATTSGGRDELVASHDGATPGVWMEETPPYNECLQRLGQPVVVRCCPRVGS